MTIPAYSRIIGIQKKIVRGRSTNFFDELQAVLDVPYSNIFAPDMSMQRKKPNVDVIKDVLDAVRAAYPASQFVQSLSFQYEERGGLSKKQLQGLYDKASKTNTIPSAKLATLEAVILKKPTRYKSTLPGPEPLYTKNETAGKWIDAVLAKYPQHKRVLFYKTKYDNNEVLTAADLAELERFFKLAK